MTKTEYDMMYEKMQKYKQLLDYLDQVESAINEIEDNYIDGITIHPHREPKRFSHAKVKYREQLKNDVLSSLKNIAASVKAEIEEL